MALKQEIERKFLVDPERLPELKDGELLAQAYLAFGPTVRVRTHEAPDGTRRGFLTIKGEGLVARDEFEYEIPFDEAAALLGLASTRPVSKTRYRLPAGGNPSLCWEIDVFGGWNEGLVVAEIELPAAGTEFEHPPWLGKDVTEDPAYKNASLARRPYREWDRSTDV
jgi:CYTH domain-containing protein